MEIPVKNEALWALTDALLAADDFLIVTHRRPDGDTVGSAGALCLILRALGKRAFLYDNPQITNRLRPYSAPLLAPARFSPQTVVAVDVASPEQLPDGANRLPPIQIVLDHHRVSRLEAPCRLVDPSAAAVGEIVYDLADVLGVALDREIASRIYIAVSTDTGCFQFSNTTARSHRIAAACMETGIDCDGINQVFFERKSPARFRMEQLVYRDFRFYEQGRVAVAVITQKMRAETGATDDDLEDFSALPRRIEGVWVGVTAYELTNGATKLSLRTTAEVDASALCAAFGGGGHTRAAGCMMALPPEEAVAAMLREIGERMH